MTVCYRSLLLATALLAAPAAYAQSTTDPVRIAVLTDMSGAYSAGSGAGSVLAAKMAVEDFGGKLLGRPVEVIVGDHQNKPDIGVSLAREWFDRQNVVMIADANNSAITLALQPVAEEKDRLVFSNAASSDLTGSSCSSNTAQWIGDSYALGTTAVKAAMERGLNKWFFLTVNYSYGLALEKDATAALVASGGTALGDAKHPINTSDFSSYLLQAQASNANTIALANSGSDMQNAIKQAIEFGVSSGTRHVVAINMTFLDTVGLGLEAGQGTLFVDSFYWDIDDQTRAFAKRFLGRQKAMPTSVQASVYSQVIEFLRAAEAAKTLGGRAVLKAMESGPLNDPFVRGGYLRPDGRLIYDMIVAEIKTPKQSTGQWDTYNVLRMVPGDQAFRPLDQGGCKLITAKN